MEADRVNQPKVYKMTSLLFGSKSSPTSAQYVKNANDLLFSEKYPDSVKAIKNSMYVDDFLCSVNTEEEAIRLFSEVTKINENAGFQMHSWVSNSKVVNSRMGQVLGSEKVVSLEKSENEKALGLH